MTFRFLLFLLVLLAQSTLIFAAPAPKMRWEYAFVKENASRRTYTGAGTSGSEYGAELQLQKRTPIFLPYARNSDREAWLLDIFSRLGNQGWELVSVPSYRSPDKYIFKRRK